MANTRAPENDPLIPRQVQLSYSLSYLIRDHLFSCNNKIYYYYNCIDTWLIPEPQRMILLYRDRYNSATAFLSSSGIICSPVIITYIIIITVQTQG